MAVTSWIIKPEHDESEHERLGDALRRLGYVKATFRSGLGGSQLLEEWTFRGQDGTLGVVAETYMDLTVTGEERLVEQLRIAYENPLAR